VNISNDALFSGFIGAVVGSIVALIGAYALEGAKRRWFRKDIKCQVVELLKIIAVQLLLIRDRDLPPLADMKRSFDRLYERCTSADVAQALTRRELRVLYRELLRAETAIVAYEKARSRKVTDEVAAAIIRRDLAGEAYKKLRSALDILGDKTDLENRRLGEDEEQ
jgi:hypothetical protein